jgi:hypothetical protein
MKLNKILLVFILIIGSIYYVLDRQLFYYGKNNLGLYDLLPLKLEPRYNYEFEGGFCIEDSLNYAIICKGVQVSL